MQDNVTEQIVSELALSLTEGSTAAGPKTVSTQAYDAFLKGWEHYRKQTPEHFAKARDYFDKAVKLDPEYSRAYAALASIYWRSNYDDFYPALNIDRRTAKDLARENIDIAMKNPTPLAHQVAAHMRLWRGRYEEAIVEGERAITLDANDADSYVTLAEVLIFDGRPQEALDLIERARRLDPFNKARHVFLEGVAQFGMGELEDAASSLERAIELNPELYTPKTDSRAGYCYPCDMLAAVYAHLGRQEDAKAMIQKIVDQGIYESASSVAYWWPYKEATDRNRLAEGLHKAGLPE